MSRIVAGAQLTIPESALVTVSITTDVRTLRLIHQQLRDGEATRYESAQLLGALVDAVALASKSWDAAREAKPARTSVESSGTQDGDAR